MLHHTVIEGTGAPIVLAHGLFGQGKNLNGLARRLSALGRPVISVDMRNHGDSPFLPDHDYLAMAGDLAEVIDAFGGTADVVGHSMGGKAAMALALTQPGKVRRVAVLDIAPLAYDHDQHELVDAMEALDLEGVDRRSVADKRLAETVEDEGVRAFLLQSLDLKAQPPRWKLNLPALRAGMDDVTGWPKALAGNRFDGPALLLGGGESDYVDAEGEAAMRSHFPAVEITHLDDASHLVHADRPDATAEALAEFLKD